MSFFMFAFPPSGLLQKYKLGAAKEDIVWTSGLNGRKSSTLE